jgi:hypothetical protein
MLSLQQGGDDYGSPHFLNDCFIPAKTGLFLFKYRKILRQIEAIHKKVHPYCYSLNAEFLNSKTLLIR